MDTQQTVAAGIESVSGFITEITHYLNQLSKRSLFQRQPMKYDPETGNQRLRDGTYLFCPCGCEFHVSACREATLSLLTLFETYLPERAEAVTRLKSLFLDEVIHPEELLDDILCNHGNELIRIVRKYKLDEELFTYFVIYLARPYRAEAKKILVEQLDLSNWNRGYCPICGHWPTVGHLAAEDGNRTLWCLQCGTNWQFKRVQCPFCLTEEQTNFSFFEPELDSVHRIFTCSNCHRYLKEVRSTIPKFEFAFDEFYFGSYLLDLIAKQNRFIQESPLTVRYDNSSGNEQLMYRQKPDRKSTKAFT